MRLRVSVIIPTYNRASLITAAVNCLLNQTRVPDEILVIDDGSTDNTVAVLQNYRAPVRVISQPNKGRSAARNTGLQATDCDLIAFLDSDDTLPPESIEHRVALLEAQPEFDAVYADAYLTDMDGNVLSKFTDSRPGLRPSGDIFPTLAYHNLSPIHAFMFRRVCLEQTGLFDITLHTLEDHDFWLRMAAHYRFAYLDEPLANYRVHDQMTTKTAAEEMRRGNILVQGRAIGMPAFDRLKPAQKVSIYTFYGTKLLALGEIEQARKSFMKAIRINPLALKAYGYFLFTLLGKKRALQMADLRRRWRS